MVVLGVDVGKADFYCSLLVEGRARSNSFSNSKAGFERLLGWLCNRNVTHVHACLEATGGRSEELALFLHEHGHAVSFIIPSAIKAFGQSELSRTKTDKADAALIARYCQRNGTQALAAAQAGRSGIYRRLGRHRTALVEMRTQEHNRLEGPGIDELRDSLEKSLAFLNRQISEIDTEIAAVIDDDPDLRGKLELLESILGIDERVASTLLGEVPQMTEFRSGKVLAAFVGLCPREFRSGTSVSAAWLSKVGNIRVRRVLYMPALAAMRCNPIMAYFPTRLCARGKRPKQIIAAVMRRMLVLAYGVSKSGRFFNAAFPLDAGHGI